ncbi:crossover junction endonuclease MUS81-like [Phalacrocorax carbo]|uniref:crossover junction endonuclease MUS81-like n=1 Tax=Phalacrocorax carbo TaxID=9209 RepID=UPI00311A7F03
MAEAAPSPSPSPSPPRRRRRRPRPSPNPLFIRWLREWRDEAVGTRARGVYERALGSLRRFPLPLGSGRAAAVLRHFGPRLCRRLSLRLRRHRAEQGLPPSPPAEGRGPEIPLAPPTRRPARDYRPLPRSAAHALLLTLHASTEPLPGAELLRQAQPLCDRPLSPAAPGGALGPLLRRDLLQRSGPPPPVLADPTGSNPGPAIGCCRPGSPSPTPGVRGAPPAGGGGAAPSPLPTGRPRAGVRAETRRVRHHPLR